MAEILRQTVEDLVNSFNDRLSEWTHAEVALATLITTLSILFANNQLRGKEPLTTKIKDTVLRNIKKLPFVRRRIESEFKQVLQSFEKEHLSVSGHLDDIVTLPEDGHSVSEVLDLAQSYVKLGKETWKDGSGSGTCYGVSEDLVKLNTDVYGMTAYSNPLHPGAFPGVRKMEAEIVQMCCQLFNGGLESCGCVTTCGTESILLACKAYREWGKSEKGINQPNMVVPVTGHASFDKAAHLFGMDIKHVKVDPKTQEVDLAAMARAIDGNTVMLVASCPQYPHGAIDDVEGVARLGLAKGIPVHVDACLGGFLAPFMDEAGYPLKPFDFRVKGVTSISADTHKYGMTPKGSSVVLYSEAKYRHFQWFTTPDWTGGIYATSTIGGSRAGGVIATCWATLVHNGRKTYVANAKKILDTFSYILNEVKTIEGLEIVGKPQIAVVAFTSSRFNVFGLSDLMTERGGWNMNKCQYPDCVHLVVSLPHTQPGVAERFVRDLKSCARDALADKSLTETESAAFYGMCQKVPDRGLIGYMTYGYLDALYVTGKQSQKNF